MNICQWRSTWKDVNIMRNVGISWKITEMVSVFKTGIVSTSCTWIQMVDLPICATIDNTKGCIISSHVCSIAWSNKIPTMNLESIDIMRLSPRDIWCILHHGESRCFGPKCGLTAFKPAHVCSNCTALNLLETSIKYVLYTHVCSSFDQSLWLLGYNETPKPWNGCSMVMLSISQWWWFRI